MIGREQHLWDKAALLRGQRGLRGLRAQEPRRARVKVKVVRAQGPRRARVQGPRTLRAQRLRLMVRGPQKVRAQGQRLRGMKEPAAQDLGLTPQKAQRAQDLEMK